jgi:hypothetical protein
MESSMMLFEEHHKWKFITWLAGSSSGFPSNFRISEGSFVGILGQVWSCKMGSFMSLVKSRMLRDIKYGIGRFGEGLILLERYLVGLYFSLDKKFDSCLLAKENQKMDGLGYLTQAKWNQVKLIPK